MGKYTLLPYDFMNKYTLLPYKFMQNNTLLYSKVVFYESYFCVLLQKNSCQESLDNCKLKSDKAIVYYCMLGFFLSIFESNHFFSYFLFSDFSIYLCRSDLIMT